MREQVVEAILREEASLRGQALSLKRKALDMANLANNVKAGDYTGEALEELAKVYGVIQRTEETRPATAPKKRTQAEQKATEEE